MSSTPGEEVDGVLALAREGKHAQEQHAQAVVVAERPAGLYPAGPGGARPEGAVGAHAGGDVGGDVGGGV